MKKTPVCLLLCLCLCLTLAAPALAEAAYPDLEGHWSREAMESLSEKGFLRGYEDGTLRPDSSISTCEALVFLSRILPLTEEERAACHDEYYDYVCFNVYPTLAWAYEELCVCLACGIVTGEELVEYGLTTRIEKELLCAFLVRALGLTGQAEAKQTASLPFLDAGEITPAFLGSAAVLVELGVIIGDDTGRFTPHARVTRAVAATMLVRALALEGTEAQPAPPPPVVVPEP